jgi:hypothetical protein
MLKNPACIVQTLNVEEEFLGDRKHWRGFSVRHDLSYGRTAHTKCGLYLPGPSLAAALLGTRRVSARQGWAGEKSGIFEHPAGGLGAAVEGERPNRHVVTRPIDFNGEVGAGG